MSRQNRKLYRTERMPRPVSGSFAKGDIKLPIDIGFLLLDYGQFPDRARVSRSKSYNLEREFVRK